MMKFGPEQLSAGFMVCGAMGFSVIGNALILLMLAEAMASVPFYVGMLALGIALLIPTLATLASKYSESDPGSALGLQTVDNNLGQFAGPLTGGLLFTYSIHLPYIAAAVPLLTAASLLWIKILTVKIKTVE